MKPIFLLFIGLSLNLLRGGAQTVIISPPTVNVAVNADSFEVKTRAIFKNTSNQTKRFTWQRNILSMTTAWQSIVCDNRGCAPSSAKSAPEVIELQPNSTSILDVSVRPNRQIGAATIEMKVYEIGNESNVAYGRFLFSTTTAMREMAKYNTSGLKIYPNPAFDFFQLTDENDLVEKVVVYNIIGRQVKSYKVIQNFKYTLADLPEGIYIIRLLNSNGVTLKTVRLNKSRPKA